MYSEKVKELVSNLPNRGELLEPSHRALGQNPICGDEVELFFQVHEGMVNECRFLARGCPAALASAAAVTELCRSRNVTECLRLDAEALLDFLGGLPRHKLHGVELALDVLRDALQRSR